MYTIIDVETTGGGIHGQRITDIAIFVHDGQKIIKEYESLVDPEVDIPFWITELTGISNETVAGAPKFEDIAQDVFDLTKDQIFVAHSVNFDYGVIRGEFERVGLTFDREKLCTVKSARKFLPGHESYSLGKVCGDLGIEINGRHRAYGDARATVTLFEMIWTEAQSQGVNIGELTDAKDRIMLPEKLNRDLFDNLPEKPGVYYFHNPHGEVIFIESAENIKERVTNHFKVTGKKKQVNKDFVSVVDITFEIEGSLLLASLFEIEEVNKLMPSVNRQRSKKDKRAALFSYNNQQGLLEVGLCSLKSPGKKIFIFESLQVGQTKLDALMRKFRLCPSHSGASTNMQICSTCSKVMSKGPCTIIDDLDGYNDRVNSALKTLDFEGDTFLIVEAGRSDEEKGIISIRQGVYWGYGYLDENSFSDLDNNAEMAIQSKEDSLYARSIIKSYLYENTDAVIINKK